MESVFHRLILFTIEGYLDEIEPEQTYQFAFMLKLRGSLRSYMKGHRFDKYEYEIVKEIAETEFMKRANEMQIDRVIFAIEMLYLYTSKIEKKKRAVLRISDDKIMNIKRGIIMDSLELKNRNEADHARVTEIVRETRINARKYYEFCESHILG